MSQYVLCAVEGCGARVMARSGHSRCSRHRPRPQRTDVPVSTPEQRKRNREKKRRQRACAGVPTTWL